MLSQLRIYAPLLIFILRIQNYKYFGFPSLQEHRPVMEYDIFSLTIMLKGPAADHTNVPRRLLKLKRGYDSSETNSRKKTPQTTNCMIRK